MTRLPGLLGTSLLCGFAAAPASGHGKEKHGSAAVAHADGADAAAAPLELAAATPETGALPQVGGAAADPTVWTLLENLHPFTVHFPIALLLVAAMVEAIAIVRPSERLRAAVDVMVVAGAIGAAFAAVFGWIHTGLWFGGDSAMHWHRWLGCGVALCSIWAAAAARRAGSRTVLRMLLAVIAAALLWQGYLGGELAHGPGHLALT
ncbi:MAG: DUF2231 domain-containing protein [Erythrobacter sp.]